MASDSGSSPTPQPAPVPPTQEHSVEVPAVGLHAHLPFRFDSPAESWAPGVVRAPSPTTAENTPAPHPLHFTSGNGIRTPITAVQLECASNTLMDTAAALLRLRGPVTDVSLHGNGMHLSKRCVPSLMTSGSSWDMPCRRVSTLSCKLLSFAKLFPVHDVQADVWYWWLVAQVCLVLHETSRM